MKLEEYLVSFVAAQALPVSLSVGSEVIVVSVGGKVA